MGQGDIPIIFDIRAESRGRAPRWSEGYCSGLAHSPMRPHTPMASAQVFTLWGDVAQEVELSSGSRRVASSIPPWACRSVPERDT